MILTHLQPLYFRNLYENNDSEDNGDLGSYDTYRYALLTYFYICREDAQNRLLVEENEKKHIIAISNCVLGYMQRLEHT